MPRLLREAGLRLVTLAEHYGVPNDEDVTDTDWLALVGDRGWVALMKDARIRYRPAERAAVVSNRVRAFCIAGGSLRAEDMAQRFVTNLAAMTRACAEPGPFIYSVHESRIVRLPLD